MGALTQYYVNPAIAGNSGTGTILDPFGDLQYALDTIARDATNGDQINVKVGTAEVLAASLTLATYGTPAEGAPLILRGYTSAAGDGGQATINGGGYLCFATNYADVGLVDLIIHTCGTGNAIVLGTRSFIYHCEVHKGSSAPSSKYLVGVPSVIGCYVHDAGTSGTGITSLAAVCHNNYVYNCTTGIISAHAIGNIVVDCATGISATGDTGEIIGNIVYSSTANTGTGISVGGGNANYVVINNVIEGYSGVGGKGLITVGDAIVGFNSFYNCTTPSSITRAFIDLTANDVALAASPFVAAATGNFALNTAVSGAIENAFPDGAWYGPASTTNGADRGAVQNGAGAGGNVNHLRGKL